MSWAATMTGALYRLGVSPCPVVPALCPVMYTLDVPPAPPPMADCLGTIGHTMPASSQRDRILRWCELSDGLEPATLWAKHYGAGRGLYRVFNAAEYRFYRSSSAPPAEGDSPFATNATLPHTPADVYGNSTWWLSVSYFNGVLDSGFLPIGVNGETHIRTDLAAGVEITSPPQPPLEWRVEARAGGVVRVVGVYYELGDPRATEWAIAYTVNGSTPATSTPDATVSMRSSGLVVLSYDLPAQSHGLTVKVRVQVRRQDVSTWYYSEDSFVRLVTADAQGTSVPPIGGQQVAPK